ncbi:MAG: nitrate ABC transporter substrate-binding protein, partial [Cellulosilyticaceae bacterium]
EEAKKFLEATAMGYEYAIANPEEAAQILVKHAPEVDLELAKASQVFLAKEYQAEKQQWGTIDESRWSEFYGWMYEQGLIGAELGNQGFTNDYLPQ